MLHHLADLLLHPALTLGTTVVTWAEVLGFLTGVVNVWLLVREHVANWAVGILNVALLLVVFWDSALYADAGLQLVYVVLGLYGWWHWLYGRGRRRELAVSRTSAAEWAWLAAASAAGTLGLWLLLTRVTDSTVPWADAVTTVLSLAATYLQCRKKVESWWVWIAADLVYIPLYLYKDLWLTAVLYVVFLGLCVAGLAAWRGALRPAAAVPA
ncbi:membrane protein [Catellatospora sp. TT07R-123]|uniref:nicotinamide riboside transporter PnuC n=1 Tax=Catellatospora sp. TT07R-123 TaxID=2733863 RepID=UPI001B2353F8|nr:nicotinamide riboside transporter PnuC [Catellatospora sp. TT07R-123]GHJ44862.1 membrane protein [Catellatospora sp. TT07R-123]